MKIKFIKPPQTKDVSASWEVGDEFEVEEREVLGVKYYKFIARDKQPTMVMQKSVGNLFEVIE